MRSFTYGAKNNTCGTCSNKSVTARPELPATNMLYAVTHTRLAATYMRYGRCDDKSFACGSIIIMACSSTPGLVDFVIPDSVMRYIKFASKRDLFSLDF